MIIMIYGFMLCGAVVSDKRSLVKGIQESKRVHKIRYWNRKCYEFLIGGRDDYGEKVMTFWLVFAVGSNAIVVRPHVDLFAYVRSGKILVERDVEFLKK